MYETLEHWKQYKQEKELKAKITKATASFSDNSTKLVSNYDWKEFDKWMEDLIAKNGTTDY